MHPISCERLRETLPECVAVGLNATLPYLRDFIVDAVCCDLSPQSPLRERDPCGLRLDELPGAYRGPGGGFVTAAYEKERLICTIGRDGVQESLTVELVLDDDGALVLRSPLPTLSVGFFLEPRRGDVGLMLGLTAYKRVRS